MIYRLYIAGYQQTQPNAAMTIDTEPQISFLFAPENPDYQNFKKEILADEAQLQDADGKTMTANKAKEFVATLP